MNSRELIFEKNDSGRGAEIRDLAEAMGKAEAVVVGAGAGLSASAGLTYSGERFDKYFFDFRDRFGIQDMYSGGFYPFPEENIKWAWWARHIYFNRYVDAPVPVYKELLKVLEGKDFFVITTNVDHQFQRAGFPKERLFYTQGDYGLFQSVYPVIKQTFDNENWVMMAMEAQGFVKDENGVFQVPENGKIQLRLSDQLIPSCPADGGPVAMNLRADDTFVEDRGWHLAAERYKAFLQNCEDKKKLFLELGVGGNTPVIIKYPFWQMTYKDPEAVYATVNKGQAFAPEEIRDRSICADMDIGEAVKCLLSLKEERDGR
ncbi:SIR2 family NAD-dependent protein deacylase [Baileyella intestinalis]|uniref:SIR2 family NAD-dependent protein deacylase n=1 Tax=Baileyella intestinalis TaxID=2606709 RepID=UPI003A83B434